MAVSSDQASLRRLWWLHPAWLFSAVIGITMAAAYLQSDAAYERYGTPKFIGDEHLALAMAAILAFVLGRQLGEATGRVPGKTPDSVRSLVQWAFWITTG